jgi:tetratricopeptide (TPR) repeat protein
VASFLAALVACALLSPASASADTRVWWAHMPLDSLRPVRNVEKIGGRTVRRYAPLRPSAHLSSLALKGPIRCAIPLLRGPSGASGSRVKWALERVPMLLLNTHPQTDPWLEVRGDSAVFDSVVYWRHLTEHPYSMSVLRRQVARLALADGDTLAADSILASAALSRSIWAWPVLRQRAELSLARGDTTRADSLLEAADRWGWPEGERAAWLAVRVRLRADLRDTSRAIEFARQALRVYPSAASTGRALGLLEDLLRARGDSLGVGERKAAVEVEMFLGRSTAAIRRLRCLVADRAAGEDRWSAGLRLCELLRRTRRWAEARATAESLIRAPVPADLKGRLWAEKARAELGAGRPDSALAIFSRLADESSMASAASWEAGRAAEVAGRWEESLLWYGRVPRGSEYGTEAIHRAGLLHLALGRADSAVACWVPDSSESARFWQGVARRALGDTTAGDSLLGVVAALPGYSFYRAAARDSLGLRGWPGGIAPARCWADSLCEPLRRAGELTSLGLAEEARDLVRRWAAGDPRLPRGASVPMPIQWLVAAHRAYDAGSVGLGISLAEQAGEVGVGLDAELQWGIVAWAFPPAFESLFVAPRDTVVAALEPALLFAVTWQESRFDPLARSRSNALGLMQLKLGTASDMARLAHDPAPSEARLFEPAVNVRHGARYLRRLLRRFDGSVAAALCAYKAGPGSVSPRWRELRARGGEALVCELASLADGRDYCHKVLAARQAYRELRPTAGP